MKQRTRRPAISFSLVLWVLLYAVTVTAYPFVPVSGGGERLWRGFYPLLHRGVPAADVLARLEAGGYRGVIAADTARLSFTTITGLETVAISMIDKRLEPFDPRLDPFMKQAAGFFRTGENGEWGVLYVPDGRGPFRFSLRMKALLDGLPGEWRVAGGRTSDGVIAAAGFLLLVAALLLRSEGRHRTLLVLGACPWLVAALTDGPGPLLGSAALYFAWAEWIEGFLPWYRQRLHYGGGDARDYLLPARTAGIAAAVLLSVGFAVGTRRGFEFLPALVLGAIGIGSLSAACLLLMRRGTDRRMHRPFLPVPILRNGYLAASRSGSLVFRALLVIVLSVSPLSMVVTYGTTLPAVPRPVVYGDSDDFSWSSLERLWLRRAEHSLPDLSDYLAHSAYQQGFLYGREYGFPERSEELRLSRFTMTEGRIRRSRETVIRYSDEWIKDTIAGIDKESIEYLLFRQGRPTGVVFGMAPVPVTRIQYLQHLLLCLASFAPTIAAGLRLTPPTLYGMRNPHIRRRKQEA